MRLTGYSFADINIKTECIYGLSGYKVVNTVKFHVWFWETSVGVGNSGFWLKQTFTLDKIPIWKISVR